MNAEYLPKIVRLYVVSSAVAIASLSCSLGSARGDILVDHPPIQYSGGPGADTSFYGGPFNQPGWETAADYFMLTAHDSIARITWYGFYGSSYGGGSWYPPSGDEYMRIRLYDARPGDALPGVVLYEETFLNPSRVASGIPVGEGQQAYRFSASLTSPFSASAATRYWLEIAQLDDIDSHYRWVNASSGTTDAVHDVNFPDWMYDVYPGIGLAFKLENVPEPCAIVLFLLVTLSAPAGRRCRLVK